jgi:hypothetical protein
VTFASVEVNIAVVVIKSVEKCVLANRYLYLCKQYGLIIFKLMCLASLLVISGMWGTFITLRHKKMR